MKLSVQIRWLKPVHSMRGNFSEGECLFVGVDCDYVDTKADLLQEISSDIGDDYIEGVHFELVNEEQFWQDMDCPVSESTTQPCMPGQIPVTITKESVTNALKVLVDNGIDADEAETVLQAIGYTLLNVELNPYFE